MKDIVREQLDALLDVGFAATKDTAGFQGIGHDQYIGALQGWLHSFGTNWAESPDLQITQGLSDRGVDFLVTFRQAGYRVGFQVWSYGDVSQKNITHDVWRQIGESGSYGLDALYLVLCGDMTDASHYQKVRRFGDLISQGSYPTIVYIAPEQAWKLWRGFAAPIDPEDVKLRVTRYARFLHAIGRGRELHVPDSVYANFESLFVPPSEYPEISVKLDTSDLVIIVGSPHAGKTFAAVKLLYDYFLQNYQPYWVFRRNGSSDNPLSTLSEVYHRERVHDVYSLEATIKPGCIVYLEDPYGSTKQEELDFVSSNRKFEIGGLLDLLRRRALPNSKHPKVVITSREGIFLRAIQQQPELSEYAVTLSIGRGYEDDPAVSYPWESRAEIAQRYIALYRPAWLEAASSSQAELESVEDILSAATSFLWTPHSLQRFFMLSRDKALQDGQELRTLVREVNDIAQSFATEMAILSEIEQLVFVTIYLEQYSSISRTHRLKAQLPEKYCSAAAALGFGELEAVEIWNEVTLRNSTSFEHVEDLVMRRREDGTFGRDPVDTLRFIHPAYLEGVALFLSANRAILDGLFTHVRTLFSSEPGLSVAYDLTHLLPYWYGSSPVTESQVLEDYLGSDDQSLLSALTPLYAVRYAYTDNAKLKAAILALVRKDKTGRQTFVVIAHDATQLSIETRCEILLAALDVDPRNLVQKAEARPYDLACHHYESITSDLREHLEEFVRREHSPWGVVGRSFGQFYDFIPAHFQRLVEEWVDSTAENAFFAHRELAVGLVLGFNSTNKNAYHLFARLLTSPFRATRSYVAKALVIVYDQLDAELRKLWHTLITSDEEQCGTAVARLVVSLCEDAQFAAKMERNGLVELVLEIAASKYDVARAEMLDILADVPRALADRTEQQLHNLLFDDTPIVRGAALYVMLNHPALQERFQERYRDILKDTSDYAQLSSLLFRLNSGSEVSVELDDEVDVLKQTESEYLRNALLFHVTTQLPLLSVDWQTWQGAETQKSPGNIIAGFGKRVQSERGVKRIYSPCWFLNYEHLQELRYYEPEFSVIETDHMTFTLRMIDELELMVLTEQMSSRLNDEIKPRE